jgi:hypothetical protein
MDALNLIGEGYIPQEPFDDIFKACSKYSRSFTKKVRGDKTSSTSKTSNGVSRVELSYLLENIKEYIIIHLDTQWDTLHVRKIKKRKMKSLLNTLFNYK